MGCILKFSLSSVMLIWRSSGCASRGHLQGCWCPCKSARANLIGGVMGGSSDHASSSPSKNKTPTGGGRSDFLDFPRNAALHGVEGQPKFATFDRHQQHG